MNRQAVCRDTPRESYHSHRIMKAYLTVPRFFQDDRFHR